MSTRQPRTRRSIARRLAAVAAFCSIPAMVLPTALAAGAETRADASREDASAVGPVLHTERYPGPYADLSQARALTVEEVVRWGRNGGMGGPQDLDAALEPGVDPPYDPTAELDRLTAPWSRPGVGPGTITSPSGSRPPSGPTGIGHLQTPFDRVQPVPDGCVGGKLVYRSMEGSLDGKPPVFVPAFGWTAAVTLQGLVDKGGPFPDWVKVVRPVELNGFGEWVYCASLEERNQGLGYSVAYESGNALVEVINPTTGERHRFPLEGSGVLPWFNEPPVVFPPVWIDSRTLTLDPPYGLGDILTRSMRMLTKLAAHGIEADRGDWGPHEIHYPDQKTLCGDEPSACYKWNGRRIHLYLDTMGDDNKITYVANEFPILHELAHSVQGYHWDGLELGGDAHELHECTSHDTAYSEGFANFLAAWATYDRTQDNGRVFQQFELEDPGITACWPDAPATEGSNEVWVAAALWDLHDHHADGADTTGAKGFGAVPALYLNNPPFLTKYAPEGLPPILQFEALYKSKLTEDKWKAWVDGIFEQNHLHTH